MANTQQKERKPRAPKAVEEPKVQETKEVEKVTAVINTPSGKDINVRAAKGNKDCGDVMCTFKNGSKVEVLPGKQTQTIAGKQQEMAQVKQGKTVGFCVAAFLDID